MFSKNIILNLKARHTFRNAKNTFQGEIRRCYNPFQPRFVLFLSFRAIIPLSHLL